MVAANHLDLLEDKRFIDLPPVDYQRVPPLLKWFADQEDYLTDELVGITHEELKSVQKVANEAMNLFIQATDQMIRRKELQLLKIPEFLWPVIEYTWAKRHAGHPSLLGRWDIIGGVGDNRPPKVIEYNVDTCTMIPETLYWQPLHLEHEGSGLQDFNHLRYDLFTRLNSLGAYHKEDRPVILGTSLGHPEDQLNIKAILDVIGQSEDFFTYSEDLEKVYFAEEGAFIEVDGGHVQVDIMIKLFPWDWAYKEEPGLAELLSNLIMSDRLIVLSPPYTTIWQNKMFLNYITSYFPNNVIARSYDKMPPYGGDFVLKSAFGRLGEEVTIVKSGTNSKPHHKVKTVQEYMPLPKDSDGYSYQIGMFYTDKPSALNIRGQKGMIINDDCEFYGHFLMEK